MARRRGRFGKKRRFGGEPSKSRLHKEMNKEVLSLKRTFNFVMVCVRLPLEDFKDFMKGEIPVHDLFPVLQSKLEAEKHYESLGHCPRKSRSLAFLVPWKKSTWLRPQLRCVCIDGSAWSHITPKLKRKLDQS